MSQNLHAIFKKFIKKNKMFWTNFQTLGHYKKIFGHILFLDKNKYPPNADLNNEKNDFINLYNDVMNSSTIYDR